jgi:hypothetical protein
VAPIEIIREFTDGKLRAMSFGMDNASDNLKYSVWLSALSTGGVALELANFQKLLTASCFTVPVAFALLLLGGVLLFSSLTITAILTWKTNRGLRYDRYSMMFYMKQRLELSCRAEEGTDPRSIILKFQKGEFLEPADRLKFQQSKQSQWVRRLVPYLVTQQILTAAGYAAIFVAAIPVLMRVH